MTQPITSSKIEQPINQMTKMKAYNLAFDLALKEAQLTENEIMDIWSDYDHLINPRTGNPYEYITPLSKTKIS